MGLCGYLVFDSPIAFQSDHWLARAEILTSSIIKDPKNHCKWFLLPRFPPKIPMEQSNITNNAKNGIIRQSAPKDESFEDLRQAIPANSHPALHRSPPPPLLLQSMEDYNHPHHTTDAIHMEEAPKFIFCMWGVTLGRRLSRRFINESLVGIKYGNGTREWLLVIL